jgi:hypothetical protein
MITDALVSFIPIGTNLSMVAGAGIAIPSSNVVDLLGNGVGVAPSNIIGLATTFGTDEGVGGKRPELNIPVGTTFTGAAGTTLKVALQGAADQGTAGNYQPSTWTDIVSQDNIALANLVAGAVIFRSPFLPTMPANLRPRFLRLLFTPFLNGAPAGASFTAGSISSAVVTMVRDDQANKFAAKNFSVA